MSGTHACCGFYLRSAQYSDRTSDLMQAMNFLREVHADELSGYKGDDFRYMFGLLNAAAEARRAANNNSLTTQAWTEPEQTVQPLHRLPSTATSATASTHASHQLRRHVTSPSPPVPSLARGRVAVTDRSQMLEQRETFWQRSNSHRNQINRFDMVDVTEVGKLRRTGSGRWREVVGTATVAATAKRRKRTVAGSQGEFDTFAKADENRPIEISASRSTRRREDNEIIKRRTGVSSDDRDDYNYRSTVISDDDDLLDRGFLDASVNYLETNNGGLAKRNIVGDTEAEAIAEISGRRGALSLSYENDLLSDSLGSSTENVSELNSTTAVPPPNFGKTYVDLLLKIAHMLHFIGIGILTFFVIQVNNTPACRFDDYHAEPIPAHGFSAVFLI